MRPALLDTAAGALLIGACLAFWRTLSHLAEKDYVAALLALIVGFGALRGAVEFVRLGVVARDQSLPAPRGDG